MNDSAKPLDVVLIGGGIMSATLGTLIKLLQPDWTIGVYEKLDDVALESSNPWNNAGTGHAALCELNYMPQAEDGSVESSKAVAINEQFQVSRQLWSFLIQEGVLSSAESFISPTPHITFVQGEANVEYLRKRYDALTREPLFEGIEFSDDPRTIYGWAPLLMRQRDKSQIVAATRVSAGTDVDFGSLTKQLFAYLGTRGVPVNTGRSVTSLKRQKDGTWKIGFRHLVGRTPASVNARFVFVGAGGGALHLLQKSGIPEIKGFGGFPISGEFLRTDNPAVVREHQAKVYGKAAVGAPPMSVPHLDKRVVEGEASLLFGPYAGFSPKFLKAGSWLDLPRSLRIHNIGPMLAVARDNSDLLKYLINEVFASRKKKMQALREFVPDAKRDDWYLIAAGQRVQVMKRDVARGGVLQFGTEVVTSADGSIAGLLGASPGASTAVPIMLDLLSRCFSIEYEGWVPRLKQMIPSLGTRLNDAPALARAELASTAKVLNISS